MTPKQCSVSAVELLNMVLNSMKHAKGPELNDANADGIDFPFSRERYDSVTYWHTLDDVSYLSSCFMTGIRYLVTIRRMNEHDWKHHVSCFKYGK
jgi:hypothetical protein